MRVRILVNPKAGAGAAQRRVPVVLGALERAGVSADAVETRAPGDAPRIVREAAREGVDCLAVMGGDGTMNEVCQAYIDAEGNAVRGPDLAIVPAGTGGDFRRTFGLGTSDAEAVTRLIASPPRPVDLGVLRFRDAQGRDAVRAFLNIASFGLGGLTDSLVNSGPKWLGGKAAFLVGTLRALLVYRAQPVRVVVDGRPFLEAPILNVALANGRYFGGGMMVAPDASPTDGLLDIVAFHDISNTQSLLFTQDIYRGTHIGKKGVSTIRGSEIRAEPLQSTDRVLIDLDGETPGQLPLTASVLPAALRLRI
jgi:YegS/Rv2252/BmrU family lipid kinase